LRAGQPADDCRPGGWLLAPESLIVRVVMSDSSPAPNDRSIAITAAREQPMPNTRVWLRELPYGAVLVLTLVGVAYTGITRRPTAAYWEFLVPVTAAVCIWSGWHSAHDRRAKIRLIWTQVAHWLAFFAAMNLLLLPNVQSMLNADATGLAILLLLALGTFVAGVHIPEWKVCILGLVMALFVPAIAWIEEAALIVLLGAIVLVGVAATFWWLGGKDEIATRT